jgi:hypothetical protein
MRINKSKITSLLIHPLFLSLLLWIVLVLLITPTFNKYRIKLIKKEFTATKTSYFYFDLDSDGISEKVSFDLNDTLQTKIIVSKKDKVLDQYDIRFQPQDISTIYTGDYNKDRYLEYYIFTMNMDSVFLNIIEPLKTRKRIIKDRFIDLRRKSKTSTDGPDINIIGEFTSKKNGTNDIVFSINSGYSLQPRNIYRYLVADDSLVKSPQSGAVISKCLTDDINGDSLPEIFISTSATGNLDEVFPYSDHFAWLMVMSNDLSFLFPPVSFGKNPSNFHIVPIKSGSSKRIIGFHDYFGSENYNSGFYFLDLNGRIINQKGVENYDESFSEIFPGSKSLKPSFYFLRNRNTDFEEYDTSFNLLDTWRIPGVALCQPLKEMDLDFDGRKEHIFLGSDSRSLVIVQSDFRDPVTWNLSQQTDGPIISQVLNSGEKPLLYVQADRTIEYLRYDKNPMYYLKYTFYPLLFLSAYLFVFIIARMQLYRLRMKSETEYKMASLQMRAIKNQIDPHFTLNVLNAIGSLYASETDREKADYIFGKYAKLIRQTVINSDQIVVPISEEIDFVRNYIDIERFRYSDSFDYSIDVDEGVDIQTKIPRMLIHTFVENAIKYGIRNRTEGSFLDIAVMRSENSLNIAIEDNGPWPMAVNHKTESTGKGLIILEELIELFYKLEKTKITYSLNNKSNPENHATGTLAIITIHSRNPKLS